MTQPKISAEAWEQAVSDFVREAPKHLRAQSMYDSAWIKQRASELTAAQQPAPESSGCMSCGCPISGAHYNGCVALQPGFNIHAQPAAGNDAEIEQAINIYRHNSESPNGIYTDSYAGMLAVINYLRRFPDSKLMDWMEANLCRIAEVKDSDGATNRSMRVWAVTGEYKTLRETISAALAANQKEKA